MSEPPRILIVTAAFGEGHNSAARNMALAFDRIGVVSQVHDPCLLGVPRLTRMVNSGYRYVTTNFPKIWERIYHSMDRFDFNRKQSPFLRRVEFTLEKLIDDFQPTAIVSTFPLYPYFVHRIARRTGRHLPLFVIVTDSMEINATWLRADSDYWLVTDSVTKEKMQATGLPAAKIFDTGFAVTPEFSSLTTLTSTDACDPFRILYFPTAKLPFVRRHARALLDSSPNVKLTIVLGRNVRLLYSRTREIKLEYPGRVKLVGWTRKVPQLLTRHHLVVGKAGGATVHEAIAAQCPMLIHHLVPGQEEGNLKLLEIIGGGNLADTPESLKSHVQGMLAHNQAGWREMKLALKAHDKNAGAIVAADFILSHLDQSDPVRLASAPPL